jgi:hypothetical protein
MFQNIVGQLLFSSIISQQKYHIVNLFRVALYKLQWKRINHKQGAKWQHLSLLKASVFLREMFLSGVKKHSNIYSKLVTPSSGG